MGYPGLKTRFKSVVELTKRLTSLMLPRGSRYRTTSVTGRQQNQRLPSVIVQLFWISLALILLLSVDVLAQQQSVNSNSDLDYGWVVAGVIDAGQVPTCQYCVNADGSSTIAADAVNGEDWNRTVDLYRCNGVEKNEIWAYESSTSSFVYSNRTLCLDALLWDSLSVLKLRLCNSSVFTQKWTWEGNHIRSNLTDPEGNGLYLWGDPPDKGQNPSSTVYTYPLILYRVLYNSYPVSPPNNGIKYVSNFTFLSNKNFVNTSTDRFTLEGLLQISNSSQNDISNGGFERTTIQAGANIESSNYVQTVPDYFSLCGWVIDYGPIDYVDGLLPFPPNSTASIHLNTFSDTYHYGSISQTIRIESGKDYSLSFYFTGFPPVNAVPDRPICNSSYTEALLQVQVTDVTATDRPLGPLPLSDGVLRQNFSTNVENLNAQVLNWTLQTLTFKANSNVTTISFSSLNFNDSCGPMISAVELTKATRSSGISTGVVAIIGVVSGLVGLIALLGIGYAIKYYRAREDYSGLYRTEHARWYSIKELNVATKKFSTVIGEGGFGTVYKADFPNGTVGAVKVEKPRGPNSSSKILASDEIALLLRVHHRNLVNLIGFCIHKGQHILVFEYLPNGSLHDRLNASILLTPEAVTKESAELQRLCSTVLSWKQRVKIAADVAWGLEYLHHEADPPIVHRDVKSHNVLLTATDAAKLADFGLSKAAPADATTFQSIETMVRGSLGYMDPQYLLTGVFSAKSDVYSFGIVLLELISGHPAIYNATSLASWAAPFLTGPSLYHEMVDKKLNGEFDASELESLVDLAKMCMQEDGRMRPNMRQVTSFLNSKQLGIIREETSEWTEETVSREAFHKKMRPMFIDFDNSQSPIESPNWSSGRNLLTISGPHSRN